MPNAIANLLEIMRDESASPRDRVNAAVSASRVEKLQLPGEEPPESIAYLRSLIDDIEVATNFRREAAAACAYFERRSAKAALTFEVADLTEQNRQWRTIANACLRFQLTATSNGDWSERRNLLQAEAPSIAGNPETTLAALLMPATRTAAKRKRKTLDDPGGTPILGSEKERRDAIKPVAKVCGIRDAVHADDKADVHQTARALLGSKEARKAYRREWMRKRRARGADGSMGAARGF